MTFAPHLQQVESQREFARLRNAFLRLFVENVAVRRLLWHAAQPKRYRVREPAALRASQEKAPSASHEGVMTWVNPSR